MAVFRVERTQNYTIMSNYHLRDKSISLKAKGLLSQMLSLPEDWDYTLTGLAKINQEGTQTPDPMCAKTRRPLRGLGERYHSGSDGPGKAVFSFPGLKAVEVPGMCL